jgi:AraC-like DNA-binding protein
VIETIRFCPETIAWWSALLAAADRIGRVHRWDVAGHGPDADQDGLEQHPTTTLVLCLAGTLRIEDGRQRCDLAVGDALAVRPGAWHRHAPLRPGALAYRQGVIAGRSDFFLESAQLRVIAAWPEQPARRLLEAVGDAADETVRVRRLRELLRHLRQEAVEPLPEGHAACLAMEYALWENLHRRDVALRIQRASGLARAQAYRVFRAHWGAGIATVVRRERMLLARSLLEAGLPVAEASRRCGIADRRTFARLYRGRCGVAPRTQRRMSKVAK